MTMRTWAATGLSTICFSLLTACGGGGDSSDSDALSALANNSVAVNASSTTSTGTYSVSVEPGDSGTISVSGQTLEWALATEANNRFGVVVSFPQNDPSAYVLGFEDNTDGYICSGKALNSTQIANINAALGSSLTSIPTCPPGVSVDTAAHSIRVNGVTLPSLTTGSRSIKINAKISWTLPA
jgi:hypothetical protein